MPRFKSATVQGLLCLTEAMWLTPCGADVAIDRRDPIQLGYTPFMSSIKCVSPRVRE